jgi:FlaA1/EpsC-like NDP-sugar epimerase
MIVVAKLQGMYDQDDLVIRKSTLDELPKLVNLATLMTMLVWLSRHFIVAGAPGTKDLLKLWILLILFTMVGRMAARSMASRAAPVERCFFVGDITTAERLRSKLENTKSVELVGATAASQVELDEEALTELVKRFEIHRIIVAASAGVAEKHVIDVVRAAKAIGLRVDDLSGHECRPGQLTGHGRRLGHAAVGRPPLRPLALLGRRQAGL